jgi:hypothetical protein
MSVSARTIVFAALMACTPTFGAPGWAWAGAWTQPQGEGLLIETLYGWTGNGAPWGGNKGVSQSRYDAQTYVEYGLSDDWTIYGQMAIERYQLGEPTPNRYTGPDYSEIGLQRKLWSTGQWVFSSEATLFLPGAHNPHAPAQEGNTGGAAEGRLLAGANFSLGSIPGFVDAEVGYRLRTAGPPDEWHGDLTVGLKPWPGWMVMLQNYTTISTASSNRNFPAWRSSVTEASLVVPLVDRWSLQIGAFESVLAVKTNTERGGVISIWRRF